MTTLPNIFLLSLGLVVLSWFNRSTYPLPSQHGGNRKSVLVEAPTSFHRAVMVLSVLVLFLGNVCLPPIYLKTPCPFSAVCLLTPSSPLMTQDHPSSLAGRTQWDVFQTF